MTIPYNLHPEPCTLNPKPNHVGLCAGATSVHNALRRRCHRQNLRAPLVSFGAKGFRVYGLRGSDFGLRSGVRGLL